MSSFSRFITRASVISALVGATFCLLLASCAGDAGKLAATPYQSIAAGVASWPQGLPLDAPQPWENDARESSGLDSDSEFLPGVERFLEAGEVADSGEASRLQSGDAGSGEIAWAMYRLELAGQEPGVLALDINPRPRSDGSQSSYFLGLSDYSGLRWEWHGPYSDNHIRLARASSPGPDVFAAQSYLSGAGNTFVTVVAFDGSTVDVLGIGFEGLDPADTLAPPVPGGLTAAPVAGGLSLQWNGVIAADLAGYRIYHAAASFAATTDSGVNRAAYVEGTTRFLLSGLSGNTFVRISAIDHNGNESALSGEVSAAALSGSPPQLQLSIAEPSILRGEASTLTVNAAASLLLDYDLDGDGGFEVTGSSVLSQQIDTSAVGIIRPRVRASSPDGQFQAYGGVSLIVAGNSRPVASGLSSVSSGAAPLEVDFSAGESADPDGSIVGGGWDFDGDGAFDAFDAASTDQLSAQHTYNAPGLFNAKLRVIDDQGAFDVDTISILVEGPGANLPPVALLASDQSKVFLGKFSASTPPLLSAAASSDPDGDSLEYSFDPEGDGSFLPYSGTATQQASFSAPGNYLPAVKVRDSEGHESVAYCLLQVLRLTPEVVTSGHLLNGNTSITGLNIQLSSLVGIAYNKVDTDDLLFIRSFDPQGSSWASPITVDSNGGEFMSLAQGVSQFNLAYARDGDLFFKASQNEGSSFNVSATVDNSADLVGDFCSCAIIGGRPAISYRNGTDQSLYYVRASNISGSSWGTPIVVDGTGTTGLYTTLRTVGSRPAISYYRSDNGNLLFVRANDADGTAWPSPVIVEGSADDCGSFASMELIQNQPAICYHNVTQNEVQLVRATDANGSAWGSPLDVGISGSVGALQLLIVNGRPLIFRGDNGASPKATFAQALDSTGTDWGQDRVIEANSAGLLLSACLSADGLPLTAYYDSPAQELHFARPRLD